MTNYRAVHVRRRLEANSGPWRAGAVFAIAAATFAGGCGALWWASRGTARAVTAEGPAALDALVALSAVTLAWLLLGWLALATLVALLSVLSDGGGRFARWAAGLAPDAVRRIAALLLGMTLVPGTAFPALAADAPARVVAESTVGQGGEPHCTLDRPDAVAACVATTFATEEEWVPDRPAPAVKARFDAGAALVAPKAGPQRGDVEQIVVRRGDTLWDLVARHLGHGASAAEVAQQWPRWYAVNRATIGPDPDLILPGQLLRVPLDEQSRGIENTA